MRNSTIELCRRLAETGHAATFAGEASARQHEDEGARPVGLDPGIAVLDIDHACGFLDHGALLCTAAVERAIISTVAAGTSPTTVTW